MFTAVESSSNEDTNESSKLVVVVVFVETNLTHLQYALHLLPCLC